VQQQHLLVSESCFLSKWGELLWVIMSPKLLSHMGVLHSHCVVCSSQSQPGRCGFGGMSGRNTDMSKRKRSWTRQAMRVNANLSQWSRWVFRPLHDTDRLIKFVLWHFWKWNQSVQWQFCWWPPVGWPLVFWWRRVSPLAVTSRIVAAHFEWIWVLGDGVPREW
jgi:hypothetical protein